MKANLRLRSLRTNLRDPRSEPCFRAKGGDRVRDRSSPSRARGDPPADREGSGRRPCARKPPRNGRDLTGARGEGAPQIAQARPSAVWSWKSPCSGPKCSLLWTTILPVTRQKSPVISASPRRRAGPVSSDRTGSFRQKAAQRELNPHRGQRLTFFLFQKQIFVLESIFGKARSRTSVQSQKMFAMVILWPLRGASI